jgi:TolA-binding protein
MSCVEVTHLQKREEEFFNQGVQFFNQGQLDDARQKFGQVSKFQGLKEPPHRNKALDYLKQIDARQGEEHTFQEGVTLFNGGKYKEAQTRFNSLAQGGGPHAGDASKYLKKIEEALKQHTVDHTFEEAVRFYNTGDYDSAKSDFKKVVKAGGPKAAEAQDYLGKIEAGIKSPEPPPTTPNEPPPSGPTAASDESLRAGLKAYFAGDLIAAERELSDYLKQNGSKQSLAYFFRGATHSTRYFLSGEKDSQEMTLAISDFQSAKTRDRAFHPPSKYIPPKIMALYSVAESPPSQ